MSSERLTSMSCIPLALRIASFVVFVVAFEAFASTTRMDCGVRSSKLPNMLCKSWCATRHLGHGWFADAARQPQKYAASSASCDSIRIPGWSTLLTLSEQWWASPFCERCFKLWKTFFKIFWYTSRLKCANSSFSAAERLVGSDGSSIYMDYMRIPFWMGAYDLQRAYIQSEHHLRFQRHSVSGAEAMQVAITSDISLRAVWPGPCQARSGVEDKSGGKHHHPEAQTWKIK